MSRKHEVESLFSELQLISPFGYSARLHIRFAAPLLFRSTQSRLWTTKYDENAFAMRDPRIFWGLSICGVTRWSEIKFPDPFHILKLAREHGMCFGAAVSCGPITSRSIIVVAREDQEFTDEEIEKLKVLTHALHKVCEPPSVLTICQIEALVLLDEGFRHASAAKKLEISVSALKVRLSSARKHLEARTTAEAIKKAREYRML
ncbi:autoinducer binding domain-containing protein [Candidatus Halocynthiibacter alkanivorans]|uniref:autoinducer binding domain-containing protein n=1 Tax=Candidatus Halocynthiibacter alkanivorans TaxID=2267619 RepID=UPI000DF2846A|nr:autoinducer binding domain-containing protein [Candidatus Halocynthiibacter alkanivorans]